MHVLEAQRFGISFLLGRVTALSCMSKLLMMAPCSVLHRQLCTGKFRETKCFRTDLRAEGLRMPERCI